MATQQRASSDQLDLDRSSSVLLDLAFPLRLMFLCAKKKKKRQNPPAEWMLETEEVACGLASRVPGTRDAEVALPCQVLGLPWQPEPLSHTRACLSPHPSLTPGYFCLSF